MTSLAALSAEAAAHRLEIFGAFHPGPDDAVPGAAGTLVLFGPSEPGFWAHLTSEPEWRDGAPDPVDRWSRRVIGALAEDAGGTAVFPFDGPPYHPFYRWALATGRAWPSPVSLLVHDTAGLMVSYRGGIALSERLDLPPAPAAAPCADCADKPCLGACPPGALTGRGYDLPGCHAFLDRPEGTPCLSFGCAVRRACPVSSRYGRLPEQSAYHMRLFHR